MQASFQMQLEDVAKRDFFEKKSRFLWLTCGENNTILSIKKLAVDDSISENA